MDFWKVLPWVQRGIKMPIANAEGKEFSGGGLLLGMFEGEAYGGSTCIHLDPGDIRWFVVAGFVERTWSVASSDTAWRVSAAERFD